jgi:CheY-like chemotaxis protein
MQEHLLQPNTTKTMARFEQAWKELCWPEAARHAIREETSMPENARHAEIDVGSARADHVSELKPSRAADADASVAMQFPRDARVLVVDDMRIVRDTIALMVRSFGLEAIMATNAAEALSAISDPRSRLDLIITDLMMPDVDGRDLIATIRAQRPHVNAILTSGCFDDGFIDNHSSLESSSARTELLPKPFSLTQLRDLILLLIGVPAIRSNGTATPSALAA